MTNWLDILKELAAQGAGEVASGINYGYQHATLPVLGNAVYGVAEAGSLLGRTPLGNPGFLNLPLVPGSPGSAQAVIAAHNQGYNGYTGGRGVWEQVQGGNPLWLRAALDVASGFADPLALGTGPALEAARGAQNLGRGLRLAGQLDERLAPQLAGYAIQGTGRAAELTGRATTYPFEKAFQYGLAKPIGFAANQTLGRTGLLNPSPDTLGHRAINTFRKAYNQQLLNQHSVTDHVPVLIDRAGEAGKTPADFTHSGVWQQIDQAATESDARLRGQTAGGPGIVAGRTAFDVPVASGNELDDYANVLGRYLLSDGAVAARQQPYGALLNGGPLMESARQTLAKYEPALATPGGEVLLPEIVRRAKAKYPDLPLPAPTKWTRQGYLERSKKIVPLAGMDKTKLNNLIEHAADELAAFAANMRVGGSDLIGTGSGGPGAYRSNPDAVQAFELGGSLYQLASHLTSGGKTAWDQVAPDAFKTALTDPTATLPGGVGFRQVDPITGEVSSVKAAGKQFLQEQYGVPLSDGEYAVIYHKMQDRLVQMYTQTASRVEFTPSTAAMRYAKEVAGIDLTGLSPQQATEEQLMAGYTAENQLQYIRDKQTGEIVTDKNGNPRMKQNVVKRGVEPAQGGPSPALAFGRNPDFADYHPNGYDIHGRVKSGPAHEPGLDPRFGIVGLPSQDFLGPNNPRQLLPNLATWVHAMVNGANLNLNDRATADWYEASTKEITALFGADHPDDIAFFLDLVGATSARTAPDQNVAQAIQAYIAYMAEDRAKLRSLGFTDTEIDALPTMADLTATTQKGPAPAKLKAVGQADLAYTHDKLVGIDKSVQRAADPFLPGPGGNKQHDYIDNHMMNLFRQQITERYADKPALRDMILASFNTAMSAFTVDRHVGRFGGIGVDFNNHEYLVLRTAATLAAQQTGLTIDQAMAGLWYWSKGLQGFSRTQGGDDLAHALHTLLDHLGVNDIQPGSDKLSIVVQDQVNQALYQKIKTGLAKVGIRGAVLPANQRISAQTATNLANVIADQMVPDMTAGATGGGTFKLLSPVTQGGERVRQLVRHKVTQGYAVAVTGTPLLPAADREAIRTATRNLLFKFGPILDDPKTPFYLGLYHDPIDNTVSVDLSLVLRDQPTAIQAAKLTHQQAIYDAAQEVSLPVPYAPGEVAPDQLGVSPLTDPMEVIKFARKVDLSGVAPTVATGDKLTAPAGLVAGSATPLAPNEQGAAVSSMLLDRIQHLNNTYVRPLLEKIKGSGPAQTLKRAQDLARPVEHLPAAEVTPTAPLSLSDPLLSAADNQALYGQRFTTGPHAGQSYGEVADKFASELGGAQTTLQGAGISYAPGTDLKTKLGLSGDKQIKNIFRTYDKYGIDPLTADPHREASAYVSSQIAKEFGIQKHELSKYETFRSIWGEQALFSPRFHAGNFLGAAIGNLLAGHGFNANPMELARNVEVAAGRDITSLDYRQTKAMETARRWGRIVPTDISRKRTHLGGIDRDTVESETGKMAAKIFGPKIGKAIGKPFELSNILAAGIELHVRGTLWSDLMERDMNRAFPRLMAGIDEMGRKQGVNTQGLAEEFQTLADHGEHGLTSALVYRLVKERGFTDGYAERAARNYAELANTAEKAATTETNRINFSYEKLNIDNTITKLIPFHYWASRALRFYGEEVLTSPVVLANYFRLSQGLDHIQQDPGSSARVKGFARILQAPAGFTLMMNPDALIGVARMLGMETTYTPEGETELGHFLRVANDHGVGLYPWISAIFNYMGAMGDTFTPDPLGLRARALVGATAQWARAQGIIPGEGPLAAPYEAANAHLRAGISGAVSAWLPDQLASAVPVKASEDGTLGRATLDNVIGSRILAANPNLTNDQLLQILTDPSTPEYQAAYKEAAQAGLLQQLLNFSAPVNFRVRENSRDVRSAAINTIRAAAKDAGVAPQDYTPTVGDATFAATYRNLTGHDFRPGDYNTAQFQRDLAAAPAGAKAFVVQDYEYENLGSAAARSLQDQANQIADGTKTVPGLPPGADPATRQAFADRWLMTQPGAGAVEQMRQLKAAYRQTHQDLETFKQWQKQMYNLQAAYGPNGFALYRQQVAANNPSFASWLASVAAAIKRSNPQISPDELRQRLDHATVSVGAWFAATGQAQSVYDQRTPAGNLPYDPATAAAMANPPEAPKAAYDPYAPTNWVSVLKSYS